MKTMDVFQKMKQKYEGQFHIPDEGEVIQKYANTPAYLRKYCQLMEEDLPDNQELIWVSREQARFLWALINSQQNNMYNILAHQIKLKDVPQLQGAMTSWLTETANEDMALNALKSQLVRILDHYPQNIK